MPETHGGLTWFSKHLIEILPAAVYVCDTNGVIVAFNMRATELWGRTPRIGQTDERFCGAHKLFRPDGVYLPHDETPMARVLRTSEASFDQEAIIERPDGSRITVLVNIAPIFDESGTQRGAVNCFQDTTAQRGSEQEREKLQEDLRQSQKMEAVGHLTGGLAHDFNNLLAGITGNLELLQTRIRQGRVNDLERYVTAALGASQRAAALTHRLLAFSRRQTLDAKPTDINRLVSGMEDLVRRTVGPGITVKMIGADDLWNTLVDPNQLENALLNLCINARDAMPAGGRLTVETSNKLFDEKMVRKFDMPAGEYVSLCVTDDGVGMTSDVAARAFDPFYTTKPIGLGTGLGLSMIYGFARQSGGQVRIHSQPGQGTTVCLYLPRQLGAEPYQEALAKIANNPQAVAGTTVLVVDDEPTIRTLVAEVLEELGYIVIEAGDGAAGLRILQSNVRVDLLITDVGLPGGLNGRQMFDAARQHRPDLRVLFITGYADTLTIGHGGLDTRMHVMTKPFSMESMTIRVKDLVAPT